MISHSLARLAGIGPRALRAAIAALLMASVGLFGACLMAASKDATSRNTPHPADARAPVPAAAYRSVTRGYESGRPAEPQAWRERNERVAPQERK